MSFSALLFRLDRLPFWGVLLVGMALGGGLGALALELGWIGVAGTLVVGGVAVALALTGEPIWVDDPVEEVETEPPDLWRMMVIEGGTFFMGSPEDEEGRKPDERQHEVTVSSFLMSPTVVTRAEYGDVLEVSEVPGTGGDQHPVTQVSWRDAIEFCNRASEKAGFEPCYRLAGEEVEWAEGNGYRLPTEAEWEFAARAGTTTRWSFGDDESELGKYAWFAENSDFELKTVGTRKPNTWKLYDMHGNVFEWCWDGYGEYPKDPVTDPRGPADSSPVALRVLRGGSFIRDARWLRSAYRFRVVPGSRDEFVGFRCVRIPRHPP